VIISFEKMKGKPEIEEGLLRNLLEKVSFKVTVKSQNGLEIPILHKP